MSREARGEGLDRLGAREVVVGLDTVDEPFYGVLDLVGGSVLARAFHLVVPSGTLVNIGSASLEPSTINFGQGRPRGADCRIVVFALGGGGYDRDLAYLVDLVSHGELNPQIGWRGSWDRADEAAAALLGRRVRGKAILEVAA